MDTLIQMPTAEEAAQISAQIDLFLEEMRRLNAEMAADRAEGERLKAETRASHLATNAVMENVDAILSKFGAR